MLGREPVGGHPATRIVAGQRTRLHHLRCRHRWHGMKHGERNLLVGDTALGIGYSKHRHLLLGVQLLEIAVQAHLDTPTLNHPFDHPGIGRYRKQGGPCRGQDHPAVDADAAFGLEDIVRHEHRLQGSTTAFDRRFRHGEDGGAALEIADGLPGIGSKVLGVVAADAVAAQRITQALDVLPAALQAGGHHQHRVTDRLSGTGPHLAVFRVEAGGGSLNPAAAWRNQRALIASGLGQRQQASSHQGPAGLVVVIRRRLEDGDIQVWTQAQQEVGHGEASGSATDDQDLMLSLVDRHLCTDPYLSVIRPESSQHNPSHSFLPINPCPRRSVARAAGRPWA